MPYYQLSVSHASIAYQFDDLPLIISRDRSRSELAPAYADQSHLQAAHTLLPNANHISSPDLSAPASPSTTPTSSPTSPNSEPARRPTTSSCSPTVSGTSRHPPSSPGSSTLLPATPLACVSQNGALSHHAQSNCLTSSQHYCSPPSRRNAKSRASTTSARFCRQPRSSRMCTSWVRSA